MNITKLELPDGRLITIEGGNAKDTAQFIAQNYLGRSAQPAPVTHNETPMALPSTFTPAPAPVRSEFVRAEEPLELPKMSFK